VDIPNALTGSRFILAGVGCLSLLLPFPFHITTATAIFVIAVNTDWLDGFLARRLGRFSPLGTFLDPLADKILILEYAVYLTVVGIYPLWLLMATIARDSLHDAFRNYAATLRVTVPANTLNKAKTTLQMCSSILALIALTAQETSTIPMATDLLTWFALWTMIIALAVGILGAIYSVAQYKRFLSSGE
jgi:CDP-diacylglycerol--glycerol-3-phosphate 3-phosphatidyltransferase